MANNLLLDPKLNPVIFYDDNRATTYEFQTPHFEYFPFEERGKDWLQIAAFYQVWQTTDIIPLQFESQFDPIVIQLLDEFDNVLQTFPALIGLPNLDYPGTWTFEAFISLAGLDTGLYRLKRILGASGPMQCTGRTKLMYISSTAIPDTIFMQWWHTRFYKDVMFETDIKFGMRIPGWIDYDRQSLVTKQSLYRDGKWNMSILESKGVETVPIFYGDEWGMPSEQLQIIERAHECDHVMYDNKFFAMTDGAKMEYIDIDPAYRFRGMHTVIEPGINRDSRIFSVETDPQKKFFFSIMVDKKAFGDVGTQGSSNTTPVINEE